MAKSYFDHLQSYQYGDHNIEARAQHHVASGQVMWSIRIGNTWITGFPAHVDDKEDEVRREVEWRVDEYLAKRA